MVSPLTMSGMVSSNKIWVIYSNFPREIADSEDVNHPMSVDPEAHSEVQQLRPTGAFLGDVGQ